ncbi:MAG: YjbF family lipoprotein [Pseudomonadota bacterium]
MRSCLRSFTMLVIFGIMLAACGSDDRERPISNRLIDVLKSVRAQKQAKGQPQAALQITREQVDATEFSLLRLTVQKTGTVATAGLFEINQDTLSYQLATSQAIYLKGGFLTGTRGLGHDLMTAAVPSSVAAAVKADTYERVHRYLTADNKLSVQRYRCTMSLGGPTKLTQLDRSYNVRIAKETCTGEGRAFNNSYAMAAGGWIWQSSQWLGPFAGQVKIEQLK